MAVCIGFLAVVQVFSPPVQAQNIVLETDRFASLSLTMYTLTIN